MYPGPQEGSCGRCTFNPATRDNQALADLGFVVVCIDGLGTPLRSKSFHDEHASKPEEMGEDTIPDQVSGIKDLASRFPWIDLDRLGFTAGGRQVDSEEEPIEIMPALGLGELDRKTLRQ